MIALNEVDIAMSHAYRGKLPVLPVKSYYGESKTECLKEYLRLIYEDKQFTFAKPVPDLIQDEMTSGLSHEVRERNGCDRYRRFIFDARCEEMKLIIQILPPEHYRSIDYLDKDRDKAKWAQAIGYQYVEMPYWMAWSHDNVKMKLDVDVDFDTYEPFEEMLEANDKMNAALMPWSFCDPGYEEFIDEASHMTDEARASLHDALDRVKGKIEKRYSSVKLADLPF